MPGQHGIEPAGSQLERFALPAETPRRLDRRRLSQNLLSRVQVPVPRVLQLPSYNGVSVGQFYTRDELVAARAGWKREGRTVVFTNGCYDVLHPGHIRLLEKARSMGDRLILALNTDSSVQRLKGPTRPLLPERERVAMALAIEAVDAVALFDEDTPRELIAAVLPDILIKGADWAHFIAGREEVEAAGGRVLALPLEPGYSTTGIVEEILARPANANQP